MSGERSASIETMSEPESAPDALAGVQPAEEWRRRAACAPVPGESDEALRRRVAVFFPNDGDYRQAARICATCVVAPECAMYADEIKPSHGWWAGEQRDAIRGDSVLRRKLACAHCGGPVGASGLRRPGGRWCSIDCYRRDQLGLPVLHTAPNGDARPNERVRATDAAHRAAST